MWTTIEQMIIGIVITLLQGVIKNPKSVTTEHSIITNIATQATLADAAVRGGTWTYTPPSS